MHLAAKESEWRGRPILAGQDIADENIVVAAGVNMVQRAGERRDGAGEQGQAMGVKLVIDACKTVVSGPCEAPGKVRLASREQVNPEEAAPPDGRARDAP